MERDLGSGKGILRCVTYFAVLHAALAIVLVLVLIGRGEVRQLLRDELSRRDLAVYGGLLICAVAVSLGSFDAISNHANRGHEETFRWALQGTQPEGGWNPLETQVLLRLIYQFVGSNLGDSWTVFVATALLLGVWGPLLAGVATQLLTRRAWVGYGLATLLVLHPGLAYWRVHAFQIAPPHVAFCGALLLAVIVARKPSMLSFATWLIWSSFAVALRPDNLGAVVGTAAIPLLLGPPGLLRKPGLWLPGFLAGSVLLGIPTLANIELAQDREDYHWGLSFLPTHLRVLSAYRPLTSPTLGVLIVAILGLCAAPRAGMDKHLRQSVLAFAVIMATSLFPDILFATFGQRHLLGTSTVGLALVMTGSAALLELPRLRTLSETQQKACTLVLAALLCGGAISELLELKDLGQRYGDDTPMVPALPGTQRPTSPLDEHGFHTRSLPKDLEHCGLYSGETYICDPWGYQPGATCHPYKNLRDKTEVRAFWDAQQSCILWAIDDTSDDVSGAYDEWEMLRVLYRWKPVGILPISERNSHAEIYRLIERP